MTSGGGVPVRRNLLSRLAEPLLSTVSGGAWAIVVLAVVSSIVVLAWPVPQRSGLEMWTFARTHASMYEPLAAEWNAAYPPGQRINFYLLSMDALGRRAMSGFLSNTPVADLIEMERTTSGQAFSGPLEDVGWTDLTQRLHDEGLLEQINAPSFGPWTSRGHIFGLPHDVHPVALAYRADLVEGAGIDVSTIETWDDFARIMRPLMHRGGNGSADRYLLSLWFTSMDPIEALLLQAGGRFFNEDGRSAIDSEVNARVISTIVAWTTGPDRIAADAPEFSASGNQLKVQGYVVASPMPDWLSGVWKTDIPRLGGKLKLMPLPAWDRGGRRVAVWGGTMLGIPKSTRHFDDAWAFAKHLYLSEELAHTLYERTGIVSPVKRMWSKPFYAAPDPYFCGQSPGLLFASLAPQVPRRVSSPCNELAKSRMQDAIVALRA